MKRKVVSFAAECVSNFVVDYVDTSLADDCSEFTIAAHDENMRVSLITNVELATER